MANLFELNINLNTTGQSEAEQALKKTQEGAANGESGGNDNKEEKGSSLKATAKFAGKQVIQIVKQAAVYDLNKAGNVYGDTARQNEIDNMMTTASMGMTVANMAMTGAQIGGGWGALIGAALGTIGEVIQGFQRAQEYKIQQQDNLRQSNYASERLGILAASKGR